MTHSRDDSPLAGTPAPYARGRSPGKARLPSGFYTATNLAIFLGTSSMESPSVLSPLRSPRKG